MSSVLLFPQATVRSGASELLYFVPVPVLYAALSDGCQSQGGGPVFCECVPDLCDWQVTALAQQVCHSLVSYLMASSLVLVGLEFCVVWVGLGHAVILVLQPPEYWDCGCVSPQIVFQDVSSTYNHTIYV